MSGHTLGDLVQQRIAGPLHLKHSYLVSGADTVRSPAFAHGHEPDAARRAPLLPPTRPPLRRPPGQRSPARSTGHVDTRWINNSTERAAGAMVSPWAGPASTPR
ncbi:hypothetical protein ABZT03_16670 [Streptomyces sp. NPDC005574]|uniref:hypothetical protein n=1 Tax=Streptomyces sp. NPDC005574 TaxID=3156891 RepID=UPI0033B44919